MTGPPRLGDAIADYVALNPASLAYRDRAAHVLPGGGTRSSYHFRPFPIVLSYGEGDDVVDIDGNRRLDLNANFGVTVHGHAFAPIVDAIREQAERAICFAAPTAGEAQLAELLRARVPSMQSIRFTSSGTEAMMVALTAARTFTGRRRVGKLQGGYHGSTEFGTFKGPGSSAELDRSNSRIVVNEDTVALPSTDTDDLMSALDSCAAELAAVVVEPVQGAAGLIPFDRRLLQQLREVTRRHDILLIFDEVMVFRIAFGGVQSLIDVEPDLTVVGKLIGGGLPVGAVGGRAEVMDVFNPYRENWVRLAGTYNGNPMTMAAGIACLQSLQPDDFIRMNGLAERLAEKSNALLRRRHVPACITQSGAFFCIHALASPAATHEQLRRQDQVLFNTLHIGLINAGVLLTPIGLGCVSTRTTEREVNRFGLALEETLDRYLD
jgi:glutamate-1-semialdehyde 2,1-aminomutase